MLSSYKNSAKSRDRYSDTLISKKRNSEADINEVFYSREFSKVCYKRGINDIIPLSEDGVQLVTGLNTDNTNPANPVVNISVDNTSIFGEGTPENPLYAPALLGGLQRLFAQTASSVPVTGTAETTILASGQGALSIPANFFRVGDSFHAKLGGRISCQNNQTLEIFVKTGTTVLEDTGVMTLGATNNDFWEIEIDFTVRAIGSAGTAVIISNGQFVYIRNSNLDYKGVGFNLINGTTFDTTILNTLNITAKWGSIHASNSLITDSCVLFKTY